MRIVRFIFAALLKVGMAMNLIQNFPDIAVQIGSITISPFDRILTLLKDFGFFKVILPFLLVFVVFYAVILKTKIFGESTEAWVKPAAAVIGFVAGFLVIAYTPVVSALEQVIPQTGFLLILVVLILLILGMVGIPITGKFEEMKPAAVIIVIVVIVIFLTMVGLAAPNIPILHGFAQFMVGFIPFELTEETTALLVAVAILLSIIGGIIYFVTKS